MVELGTHDDCVLECQFTVRDQSSCCRRRGMQRARYETAFELARRTTTAAIELLRFISSKAGMPEAVFHVFTNRTDHDLDHLDPDMTL